MLISVLILTLNEEANIGGCITSLPWRNDIFVLDSGSTDKTVEIASKMGAKIVTRPFTDYADQRNFGFALPFQSDWIVCLDADERIAPCLGEEIEQAIASSPGAVMLRMRRKDIFMGRWLRRSSGYPTWFPRIFRCGCVRVDREVNEIYTADGPAISLNGHILHYPFNKGLDWWFDRHNRYSAMEARLIGRPGSAALPPRQLFSRDPLSRRAALKALAYRLPCRPFLIFIYLYFIRMGFLDGGAGYRFACARLAYELMIDTKIAYAAHRGRRNAASGLAPGEDTLCDG